MACLLALLGLAALAATQSGEGCPEGEACPGDEAALLQRRVAAGGALAPEQMEVQMKRMAAELSELKDMEKKHEETERKHEETERKHVETESELKDMLRLLVRGQGQSLDSPHSATEASAASGAELLAGGWPTKQEKRGALFEMCRAGPGDARPGMRAASLAESAVQASVGERATPCDPLTEIVLEDGTAQGVVRSCCPIEATWCSGCASAGSGSCEKCLGGYTKIGGHCTPCIDTVGWSNYEQQNCFDANCSDYKIQGQSSNEACCKCGGGQQAATPFVYVAEPALLVSDYVRGYPVPRTAERYSLDEACELSKHGLTIDGHTGALKLAKVLSMCDPNGPRWPRCEDEWGNASLGTEPFEVSCTITAHQTDSLNATATLTVRANWFAYKSVGNNVVLWNTTGDQEKGLGNYEHMCGDEDPRSSSRRRTSRRRDGHKHLLCPWRKHKHEKGRCTITKRCAAEQTDEWMFVNHTTGALFVNQSVPTISPGVTGLGSLSGQRGSAGGLCELSVKYWEEEGFPGQASTSPVYVIKLDFTPLAPRPWTSFGYLTQHVAVTVGERSPPLYLQAPEGELLKPERFSIACSESPSQGAFAFDITTGVATLGLHHAFTLDITTGAIRAEPSKDMTIFLDQLITSETRRQVSLDCAVIGHYVFDPSEASPWVSTPLKIVLRDDTCWVNTTAWFLQSTEDVQTQAISESACRRACRNTPNCTHFEWTSAGECIFPHVRCLPGASTCMEVAAVEKITNCGERKTCVYLNYTNNWDYSGEYCPQVDSGFYGLAYERVSVTAEDTLWLVPFDPNRDTNCSAGQYLLRRTNAHKDFQDNLRAVAEFNGQVIACLDLGGDLSSLVLLHGAADVNIVSGPTTSSVSASIWEPSCPAPNITEVVAATLGEQGESEGFAVDPLWLDDASTSDMDDFSLHPCSCFPVEWGLNAPVIDESLQDVPPQSNNQFYPNAFQIVEGEYVCEADATNFITITLPQVEDDSLIPAVCEDTCWSFGNCTYFFAGKAGDTPQCRFYSSCTVLVREAGILGALNGLPRRDKKYCRIADPQTCAKVSTRREYLGAGTAEIPLDPASKYPCLYQDLLQQCDLKLLYEQLGIEKCGVCTYADQDPALWQYKRIAPAGLPSGYELKVGCFNERYTPVPASGLGAADLSVAHQTLTCLSGKWVSSDGSPGLTKLACGACITVGALDYKNYQEQDREELWFTERLEVELFVASNPPMRVSSSGALEQAPIVRRSSPTPERGNSVIYGAMQNSFYCIGVNSNDVVEVDSSKATPTVTVVPSNWPSNDTFVAQSTVNLEAYGVFDGDNTFIPLRQGASYELNTGFTGGSQSEPYDSARFQAMARGLSQYNQAGMPFVSSPWAETGDLKVIVHTVTVNGVDFPVENSVPVDVSMSGILFNSDTFPKLEEVMVTLTYNGTYTVDVAVKVELNYIETLANPLDLLTRVTCDSAQKLDIGWKGGNSSYPGPLLQEFQNKRCLAVSGKTYYKNSDLVVLEACDETSPKQKWDYYSETVLQNVGNSLCMTVADEGSEIVRLRMVPCSSADAVLEQGPFSFNTNPYLVMEDQDCHYDFVSETDCPLLCGGAYKTVTWNIKSPARGRGQACPASEVPCGLAACGEGSPGGWLMETFPDAAIGVKMLRSTQDLTSCLQYNASETAGYLLSVGLCDVTNKLQQLDSAKIPEFLWKDYRHEVSMGRSLTSSTNLTAKFSLGEEHRYMSDLVFSKDCMNDAVVSHLHFNATNKPGIEATCILAARKFDSVTSETQLKARRGDVIEGIYGGTCMGALQLAGGGYSIQMQQCNFAERAQRWYWSAGGYQLHSELGDDLCLMNSSVLTASTVANATLGSCSGASSLLGGQTFTFDDEDRLRVNLTVSNTEVCLGWLGGAVVFHKCLGKNDPPYVDSNNKMTFSEQQWRVGNGLMGLRDVVINCIGASGVTFISFYQGGVTYRCNELSAVGGCFLQESRQVDTDTASLENLMDLEINCGEMAVLKQVTPEYSLGGKWLRFKYICCKITEPSAIVRTGRSVTSGSAEVEGVYCPLPQRDISGRLVYQQRSCYNESACVSSPVRQMTFDHKGGAWCVQGDCVPSDVAVPTDTSLVGTNWEALPVLDFDFTPPARGASSTKKQRTPPQLIEFSAVEPEYAEECQNDVTPGQRGFDRERMNDVGLELPAENPCSLVAAKPSDDGKSVDGRAGWTASTTGDKGYGYTYSDVVDCWDRDIKRQESQANQDQGVGFTNLAFDSADVIRDMLCTAFPGTGTWAGIGAGGEVTYSWKDKCEAIGKGVMGLQRYYTTSIDLAMNYGRAESDRADCKETTAGLSRIFCDLHCIRDAVKAGDQAILQSMEKAARIQTENTKLLVEYYTGLISDKLDGATVNPAFLQEQAQTEVRQAQQQMASLFEEMRSWASSGQFGEAGTTSVSRALSKYVADGSILLGTGVNVSLHGPDLTSGLDQLVQRTSSLHAAFRGATTQKLSKNAEVERRVFQFATQKQETLRTMSKLLGVYKHRSEAAKRGQQHLLGLAKTSVADLARQMEQQSTESLLLSLDSTWWELRAIIDQQLEASSAQVEAFTHVTGLLQDYMSACSLAYPEVLAGYHRAVASAGVAKQHLKEAWQKAVPLYGLLASKVVDGDAFLHMARADLQAVDAKALLGAAAGAGEEGDSKTSTLSLAQFCDRGASGATSQAAKDAMKRAAASGGLFLQTVQQLDVVAIELHAMGDRFEAAGLGKAPLLETVTDATERLALALKRAAVGYDGLVTEAVADLQGQSC